MKTFFKKVWKILAIIGGAVLAFLGIKSTLDKKQISKNEEQVSKNEEALDKQKKLSQETEEVIKKNEEIIKKYSN